jgi:hypothetical protein
LGRYVDTRFSALCRENTLLDAAWSGQPLPYSAQGTTARTSEQSQLCTSLAQLRFRYGTQLGKLTSGYLGLGSLWEPLCP